MNIYLCFNTKHLAFKSHSDFILTHGNCVSPTSPLTIVLIPVKDVSRPTLSLTVLYTSVQNFLKAIAYLGKKYYLCIEMSRKGLISRMSDECLITLETAVLFYVVYQAVMRKFTLAGKS